MTTAMEQRIDVLIAQLPPLTNEDFQRAAAILACADPRRRVAA